MPAKVSQKLFESHLVEGKMPVPTDGVEEAAMRAAAHGVGGVRGHDGRAYGGRSKWSQPRRSKKYSGLMPSEIKRLKKLVADLSLDKEMLQDVIRRKM
jgi:putative transposase